MEIRKFFLLILISSIPLSLSARTVDICPSCDIKSLQEGINKSISGDILRLHTGIYREGTITVDRPLKILGVNDPVIDGEKRDHVIYVKADNVSMEGLIIKNSGQNGVRDLAGIKIVNSKNCIFRNNILLNNTYSFFLSDVSGCNIQNNLVIGNAKYETTSGNGVHLWKSSNVIVKNNYMSNHRDGLYLEFSHDSSFSDNVCADNIRYGMHFMFSNNNSFHNNHYMRNQTGVAVMYSKNVHMTNNWFERKSSNAFYGMLLKEMTDSFIEGNIFIGNITGIYIDGSNRNQIKRNLFQTNGWAVQIYSNSTDNEFSENNFLSNQFDVITNTRRNNSKFFRNFWDRYRGYDLDRDSSGDVPYWPVSVFSSWVGDYHELSILLNSPVVKFLELAERIFPVLTPKELLDKNPSMKPFARLRHSETDPLLNANFIR